MRAFAKGLYFSGTRHHPTRDFWRVSIKAKGLEKVVLSLWRAGCLLRFVVTRRYSENPGRGTRHDAPSDSDGSPNSEEKHRSRRRFRRRSASDLYQNMYYCISCDQSTTNFDDGHCVPPRPKSTSPPCIRTALTDYEKYAYRDNNWPRWGQSDINAKPNTVADIEEWVS